MTAKMRATNLTVKLASHTAVKIGGSEGLTLSSCDRRRRRSAPSRTSTRIS